MELYEIIKALQNAQGSNAKQAILESNKDNKLLKDYLKAVYDPAISYYQKKIAKPKNLFFPSDMEFSQGSIDYLKDYFAGRKYTGDMAKRQLTAFHFNLNSEGKELLELIINRSIGAGVGETMVLKSFPELFFIPPYMRCSLMTPKIKEKFKSQKRFIVQKKSDGSFTWIKREKDGSVQAFTRAGTFYPDWITAQVTKGLPDTFYGAIAGEMLVYPWGISTALPRQEGNGILNSILKGEEKVNFEDIYFFQVDAWDIVPLENFKSGSYKVAYIDRLKYLEEVTANTTDLHVIETAYVSSLKEAKLITTDYQKQGFEGSVYKTEDHFWKDGTSTENIKDKVVFEADYLVEGIYEGEGKAKGMMGGMVITTVDKKLRSNMGTGFSDAQRKYYWENDPTNTVVTASANDVITNQKEDVLSLFLPVFVEERLDKKVADTLEQVYATLEAAKNGEAQE